jgi:predicted site-specific integrase-resolvase
MAKKTLTIREAAKLTGAAIWTVGKWCRTGKLPNAKKVNTPFGEYWEIPESDLANVEVKMGRPRKD